MTFTAHAISASIFSLMIAGVEPSQTSLVVTALVVPAALDLDHVVMLFVKRKVFAKEGLAGNLHKARSFMHELLGVFIVGLIYLWLRQENSQLAAVVYFSYLIHVIEDMIMGISRPFYPVSKTECRLFKFKMKQKAIIDTLVIIGSLWLWAKYLKG